MTFEVWKYAVRGLYEQDKMTFTLLLTLKIDMQGGKVKREEFMTFIKGMLAKSQKWKKKRKKDRNNSFKKVRKLYMDDKWLGPQISKFIVL